MTEPTQAKPAADAAGARVDRAVGPLPTVARLYYTGHGSRRYKRASVRNGPGEALTFTSTAEQHLRWQAAAYESEGAALRSIGGQLANVAFNWAQKPGYTLTSDDVALLDKLRRAWDDIKRPNVGVEPPAFGGSARTTG